MALQNALYGVFIVQWIKSVTKAIKMYSRHTVAKIRSI